MIQSLAGHTQSSQLLQLDKLAEDSDFLRLDRDLRKFNIFDAIGIERQELRHSDFLAFLLNPYRDHGLGGTFIEILLNEIQKKYPYAKAAQASFENLKPRPVTPFYPEMSSEAIQPAFGQAMARQIPPDQAIKQMADKMRQILKKG